MKLLLDENVAFSTTTLCRDLGYNIKHVKEDALEGRDDKTLLALAVAENRVLLSFDKDFGNLLSFPLSSHFGVIVIEMRDQRPQAVNRRLSQVLPILDETDLTGKLIILRDGDIRVRSLEP